MAFINSYTKSQNSSESTYVSIKQQLNTLIVVHSECCIYVVPESLRQVNPDAYQPLLVSIGPVHCRDPRLADMHQQKLRYLHSFLLRYPKYSYDEYLDFAKGWNDKARKSYIETIELPLSKNTLAEMLLLDAAFIIELFMRFCSTSQTDPVIKVGLDDRIFNKPRELTILYRDIKLEENQLPFFILVDLYKRAIESPSEHPHPAILDIMCRFFKVKRVPQGMYLDRTEHLLGFLRQCYLPTHRREQSYTNNQEFEFTLSVTKLRDAGVKFKVSKSANLLDISFSEGGVLEIPGLKVTDDTESLFRNIMAFEQCHHYYDSYIIDYFAFLNSLINTAEDVEILVKGGIIENWLGNNEEVANLFSKIFKETILNHYKFYYYGICRDLNTHANTRWHRWIAILKRNYFSHPWALLAVGCAFLLLVLAVLQVITGFKSVNWI